MNSVYGPVPSWRLGRSLGVDPICGKKVCNFDCIYCQLGRTSRKAERRKFVEADKVREDIERIIDKVSADVITLSGTGEPTLAENLNEIIDVIREMTDLPIAILTNSSLLHKNEIVNELRRLDHVIAKLDVPNQNLLEKINRPVEEIEFDLILRGLRKFRNLFDGKFSLQIMFVKENERYAKEIASLARELDPDEVQINTPLRPCPVEPLSENEIKKISKNFERMNFISVYESERPRVKPMNKIEVLRRRPEE